MDDLSSPNEESTALFRASDISTESRDSRRLCNTIAAMSGNPAQIWDPVARLSTRRPGAFSSRRIVCHREGGNRVAIVVRLPVVRAPCQRRPKFDPLSAEY
jgi:hypothetical protein